MRSVTRAMQTALTQAFGAGDDFDHAFAGAEIGKPGEGGFLFETAVLETSGDAISVRFTGGYFLRVEGLTSFGISSDGFAVVDADEVILGQDAESSRVVANRESCIIPTVWGDERRERLSDVFPIWECLLLRHLDFIARRDQ